MSIKSGLYSLPFRLHVYAPRAVIVGGGKGGGGGGGGGGGDLGGGEIHLDRGSTIALHCIVRQATDTTQ